MPHLAHRRMPCPSRPPSSTRTIPQPVPNEPQSSNPAINSKAWPPFPPPQSLSEDTAQLHLTLSPPPSHSPSPSPSPSPLVSRHPSSGTDTPESEGSVPTSVAESSEPDDACIATPPESPIGEGSRSKKNNRMSAALLASLLSASPEVRRERKERKRTEKFTRHEQAVQELRSADRRRAYFRDASHRQELTFGPKVCAHHITISGPTPPTQHITTSVDR
jgi:hypothetical protein